MAAPPRSRWGGRGARRPLFAGAARAKRIGGSALAGGGRASGSQAWRAAGRDADRGWRMRPEGRTRPRGKAAITGHWSLPPVGKARTRSCWVRGDVTGMPFSPRSLRVPLSPTPHVRSMLRPRYAECENTKGFGFPGTEVDALHLRPPSLVPCCKCQILLGNLGSSSLRVERVELDALVKSLEPLGGPESNGIHLKSFCHSLKDSQS